MIENIKVVACDIDLTLTSKGGTLPEVTKEAFEKLHQQGVLIGLASGRTNIESSKSNGRNWGLSFEFDFVIGFNGGIVYNRQKDTMYSEPLLTLDEMKEIIYGMKPIIDKNNVAVNCEGGGNYYAMNIEDELIEAGIRHGIAYEDATGDVEKMCSLQTYKFLFRGKANDEDEIREYFNKTFQGKYTLVGTFPGTVEIMNKGFDKGTGLKRYCDDMGISLDNVIAFGDYENDDAMLDIAGWSVALKDGSEETKKHADDVTAYDCLNGGVGHYLLDNCINK